MKRLPATRSSSGGAIADGGIVRPIRPAHEQVAEQLRTLILSGNLAAGERLPVESQLATSFGVSRTTVRDAIRRLAAQGLVDPSSGQGAGMYVASTDHAAVSERLETGIQLLGGNAGISPSEFFETRALLEIPAARLAALRREPETVLSLRTALEFERTLSRREERFEVGQHFHAVILATAGNRLLTVLAAPLFNVIRTRFLGDTQSAEVRAQIDADHAEILACIEGQQPDEAASAMGDHLDRLRSWYDQADGWRPRAADTKP